jgi:hypothetical protein
LLDEQRLMKVTTPLGMAFLPPMIVIVTTPLGMGSSRRFDPASEMTKMAMKIKSGIFAMPAEDVRIFDRHWAAPPVGCPQSVEARCRFALRL